MSDEQRIQRLLSALRERMESNEISQETYDRLSRKYGSRLSSLKNLLTSICANCGETIKIEKKKKRFTCPSCGFTNKLFKKQRSEGPEEQIINDLSSVEERMQDYKRYRQKVGPQAMDGIKHDLSQIRFKISHCNLASSQMLMERALSIEKHLEVLERYYEDYERFEELGVNPDGSLKVTFRAAVPPRGSKERSLGLLRNMAERIAKGEGKRMALEQIGKTPILWELADKETGFYVRDGARSEETPRSRNPFLTSLESLSQRERHGEKFSGDQKKLVELYSGWESKTIDAFRIQEADVKLFPERELVFSLEEEMKGIIRKKVKKAAINVWRIAKVWVAHWRLTYTSALGEHNTILGALARERLNPPVKLSSIGKKEFLSPNVDGNAEEWFHKERTELIDYSRRLTSYERKLRLWTKKEDYAYYARPVARRFEDLGLAVEYTAGFLKMGLKVEGKWLRKGEYEKIAASLELVKLEYVYLPAYFGMFQSTTTYCVWFYLQSLINGAIATLNPKHPIVEIVAEGARH